MKPYRTALVLLTLVIFSALTILARTTGKPGDKPAEKTDSTKATTPNGITWVRFDEGLQRAEAENKLVLVDITASWCGWCKKMDKETFTDTAVINLINGSFVPVKLWGDSDKLLDIKGYKISEKDLVASTFGATGFPTFVFLCPDSRGIAKAPGYRDAEGFRQMLTAVRTFNCDSAKASDKPGNK